MLYQLSYAPDDQILESILVETLFRGRVVGLTGFEPVTSRLSGGRSNQLSYRPNGIHAARPVQRGCAAQAVAGVVEGG